MRTRENDGSILQRLSDRPGKDVVESSGGVRGEDGDDYLCSKVGRVASVGSYCRGSKRLRVDKI